MPAFSSVPPLKNSKVRMSPVLESTLCAVLTPKEKLLVLTVVSTPLAVPVTLRLNAPSRSALMASYSGLFPPLIVKFSLTVVMAESSVLSSSMV
jgi:hypothetical protein